MTLMFVLLRREKLYARLIILSLVLAPSACRFQAVHHDPVKAASDTNRFLKAAYFDRDYAAALRIADEELRQSLTTDELKDMADEATREVGALKSLTAESYFMMQGATMQLYYTGRYEKGVLYHCLVLVGDASSGYKVVGVWFRPEPFPDKPTRRKFDVKIVLD